MSSRARLLVEPAWQILTDPAVLALHPNTIETLYFTNAKHSCEANFPSMDQVTLENGALENETPYQPTYIAQHHHLLLSQDSA